MKRSHAVAFRKNFGQLSLSKINAARVIQRAYRTYRQYRKTQDAKSSAMSGYGVTQQNDRTRVYRYKRMPRWKKKRWIKFTRKVQATIDKNLPTRTVVLNDLASSTLTGPVAGQYNQAVLAVHLYGRSGTNIVNEVGTNDMQKITINENPAPPSGSNFRENSKIVFTSAVMDLTFFVVPPDVAAGTLASNVFEVDLYDIVYRKTDTAFANLLDNARTVCASNTRTINSATVPQIIARGVTPFECGEFLSQTKMKILKKVKYFITGGQAITYQVRDPRNHQCKGRDMVAYDDFDFNMKNMTRTVLLIGKPIDRAWAQINVLNCNVTRTYKYYLPNPEQGVSAAII